MMIAAILILLGLNMTSILTGQPLNQKYLRYNDVRGMAISNNKMLYTLNFKQQNTVIDILNAAVPIDKIEGNRTPANIEQMVIYQFDNAPDIVLIPIGYVKKNLVFAAPKWVPNGYLMELSDGNLQKLLSQTYD